MTPQEKIDELIKEAAVSVFVCDEEDKTLIDQYNLLMNEVDETKLARDLVTVWEPFEEWNLRRFRAAVEANEEYIRTTFNEILILTKHDQGRETG